MSADITEEFQVDLSNLATTQVVTQNTDLEYSYAFNGIRFMDASSTSTPYRRETAQYQKDQTDDTSEAGEQSLTGWWLRSQSSFHLGSGVKFYEPAQDQSLRFRFADSQGVNPWVKGEVSLLKDVDAVTSFSTTTSQKANLRTISTGVLVHDNRDVYKVSTTGTVVHLVDFAVDVYSITDDGKYLYWIANVSSKGRLYRKPLSSTSTSTEASLGDAVELYDHPSTTPTNTYMEFVKDRIIVASGNVVYKADLDNSTNDLAAGSPEIFYTHPNTDYVFDSIVESPSDVYISGYQGAKSAIYQVVFQDLTTLGLPEPAGLRVVAEMPLGEQIHSLKYYLGYLAIGTSKGVRVAAVNDDGSITYGPLVFNTSGPVHQIAASDRFIWVTAQIGSDCGLIRIDLSAQIESLVFPYANDLQAIGDTDVCVGVAVMGSTGRIAFSAEAGNLYFESATEYRTSGFVRTGLIRFNTLENKFFKYVRERAVYNGNTSVGISVNGQNVTIATSSSGNTDVGVPDRAAAESHYYTFTLYGDTSDTTKTPVLLGYQLKALPAVKRQRLFQYPLWVFDHERDSVGNEYGFEHRAYQHLRLFENLEESSDIVTVQDFRTGEQFQALIEECSFSSTTPPDRHHYGFGGRLLVTVRKI
jgi:hypothetical protein